ncbi:MAG TPA: TonB-dependent receptor [Steroidobacteraceae bacterium]|nr:TonB-dependent receptor [Steroidobacteraceae bacterium]
MNIKKVGVFALACIATASIAVPLALAQSAPANGDQSAGAATDTLQEVVVSGLRQSLNQAQMIKSLNPDVVDAIVAQDIGKFPDNTVGDALQRVPGVQVTRDADQIIGVNIRGLPNVETTLNGDEIFTTNLRTFDFQNMPAEALAGVDVYKTSSADQIEGGIAGLIDVRTHRPFDFQGFEAAGSATDQYDSVADSHNPVVNALVSDRWQTDAGEFGALINASFSREQYDYPVVWEDTPHNPEPTSETGYPVPLIVPFEGSETTIGSRKYPEINVALQFKPNDSLEFYSDSIYTGYAARYGSNFFFTVTSNPEPLSDVTLAGCTTVTGGYGCQVGSAVVGGPGNYPYTATSTQAFDAAETDFHSDIGVKYQQGPWTISSEVDGTLSRFHQRQEIIDTSLNDETVTFNSEDNGHERWSLSGPSPDDPANLYLQNLFEAWQQNSGSELAWRNQIRYDFSSGFFKAVEGGLRLADRKSDSTGNPGISTCVPGATPGSCNDGNVGAVSAFGPDSFQQFNGGDGNAPYFDGLGTSFLLDNVLKTRAYYDVPLSGPPADPTSDFSDNEFTTAFWGQALFSFHAGPVPVDGQLGLRTVIDDRTLSGTNAATISALTNTTTAPEVVNGVTIPPGGVIAAGYTAYSPYSIGTQGIDWLPSIGAVAHWTPDLQSHFSVARTVTRPAFSALNPALTEIPPTVNRQGNGSEGNPDLAPTKVTAYDATLEYYASGGGMAALEAFYRTVTGYIEPETLTVPYSTTFCTSNGIPTSGGLGGQCNVMISTSASSGTGFIDGFEVEAQKFFSFLPSPFDGFGVQTNYSWIDSSAPIPGQNGLPTITGQLTNVSKNNASVILMYEKYGLSARLATTYRSSYIESYYPGNDTYPPIDVVRPTVFVDLSIYYDVSRNLALSAAATNLTNAYYNSYSGIPLFPRDIRVIDRTYRFGVHYKFD